MPRVLLLMASTSYRARDFLAAAAALGIDVVVGSDHRQVLARYSGGRSLAVDFLDLDRSLAAILAHAGARPVDAVIGTDDEGAILAAVAARALGLSHNDPDAVAAARDKLRFREALHAAGIPGPRFKVLALDGSPRVAPLGFPCVVKPRSLSASRGVLRVDRPQELVDACECIARILATTGHGLDASERRSALLEEYIHGDEMALEGMLHEGRLQVLALFDKPDPMHGPTFEETLLVTPSRHAQAIQDDVAATVQAAARALGLRQGPVHAEVRINADGVWMVELAPRSLGGLCSRTLRFADGDSLEALVLRNALGLPVPAPETAVPGASGVMMIHVPRAGRLQAVDGVAEARGLPGIDDVIISIPAGDAVVPLPEGDRYLGFIFASGPCAEGVERALRVAHGALRIGIPTTGQPRAAV